MSDDPAARCGLHPDAIAGWRCDAPCGRDLCGQCTAKLLQLYSCSECGGAARRLVVPRRSKSFGHWVGATLLYPVRGGIPLLLVGALLLGAIPFVISLVATTPGQGAGLATKLQVTVLALIALLAVDVAARPAESGLLLRLLRELVATAIVWAPIVAYVVFVGPPRVQRDPMLWLYAVLALTYTPLALAVAVTDASFGDVLDPFKLFRLAGQLAKPYLGTLVVVLGTGALVGIGASMAPGLRASVATPFLRDALAIGPMLAAVIMLGHAIGMLPFVHGDRLGWGSEASHSDPLHPEIVAEGKRKLVDRPGAAAAAEATGEVGAAAPAAPAERREADKILEALKREDGNRALRMFDARPDWNPTLIDDRTLVALGKAAARAKKLDQARKLFDEAVARNGRGAGHALLALAQLLAVSLGQEAEAQVVYRQVVEQFPGTDLAKIAASKLDGPAA